MTVTSAMHAPVIGGARLTHDTAADPIAGASALILPEAQWFGVDWCEIARVDGARAAVAEPHSLPGYAGADLSSAESCVRSGSWPAYGGMDMREVCRGSIACLAGTASPDLSDPRPWWAVIEQAARTHAAVRGVLADHRSVRSVVVCNGLFHTAFAAAAGARSMGRRAVAVEGCCFPGLVYAEADTCMTGTRSRLGRMSGDAAQFRALSEAERDGVAGFMHDHLAARGGIGVDTSAVRRRLGVPPGARVMLVLGQVATDTTMVYEAPALNEAGGVVCAALDALRERRDWVVVVKPHPKEDGGRDPVFHRLYGNATYERLASDVMLRDPRVRLLHPRSENVYELMALADACVTVTSQAGLEYVAGYGKTCVVLGDAFYARKGFTTDVAHASGVAPAIRSVLDGAVLGDAERDRCARFMHHVLRHGLIDVNAADAQSRLVAALFGEDRHGP